MDYDRALDFLFSLRNKMAAPTRFVNPNAEVVSKTQALMVNVAAARGLQNVLKTNLGEQARCVQPERVECRGEAEQGVETN